MKTIRTLLGALILLVALNVNAADGLDLRVNDQQNLIVELQRIEKGAVLSLQDAEGEILFKDRFFEENSYSKTLDFYNLPDGIYTLSFNKQYSISNYRISKKGEKLSIDEHAYNFTFKPAFENKNEKVFLHLSNPEQKSTLVEIFDNQGFLVGAVKTNDLVVKKTLDFSNVPKGNYSVKVKIGENSFIKVFTIS